MCVQTIIPHSKFSNTYFSYLFYQSWMYFSYNQINVCLCTHTVLCKPPREEPQYFYSNVDSSLAIYKIRWSWLVYTHNILLYFFSTCFFFLYEKIYFFKVCFCDDMQIFKHDVLMLTVKFKKLKWFRSMRWVVILGIIVKQIDVCQRTSFDFIISDKVKWDGFLRRAWSVKYIVSAK